MPRYSRDSICRQTGALLLLSTLAFACNGRLTIEAASHAVPRDATQNEPGVEDFPTEIEESPDAPAPEEPTDTFGPDEPIYPVDLEEPTEPGDPPEDPGPPPFDACEEELSSASTLSPMAVDTATVTATAGTKILCVSQGETFSDGHSCWRTPFPSIQSAVEASADGDEIWIAYADGAPYGGQVTLKTGIALFGGFAGGENARDERNPATQRTVIGDGTENILVQTADRVMLDGMELRTSPIARSITVLAVGKGVKLHDVQIRGKEDSPRIAIVIYSMDNDLSLERCLIENIDADYGVLMDEGSHTIRNSVFRDVRTAHSALTLWQSRLTIEGTHFIRTSGEDGGAIRSNYSEFAITNSVFYGNTSSRGSALFSNRDRNSTITHTTFYGNRSLLSTIESLHTGLEIVNSVFGSNESLTDETLVARTGALIGVRNSALPQLDGFRDDGNNIWADIDLAAAADEDFSLPQGSPAIDAADASHAPDRDAQGRSRFDDPGTANATMGEFADLGAYEFVGHSVLRLLTPNGGQRFSKGGSQRIAWHAEGIDAVNVEYSEDGGKTWSAVETGLSAGAGAATVDVPGRGTSSGRLRLSGCAGRFTDSSDTDFTVVGRGDWFVNPAADVHDGTTFASGFATVHDALAVARHGEKIHVVEGNYRPSPDGGAFALIMKDGVDIIGGYSADGVYDPDTYRTILNAEAQTWRERSVVFGANAQLRGFELTGGGDGISALGGSVLVVGKHLTLSDSVVRNNREGVYVSGPTSRLTVTDSEIRDNRESTYFAPSGITVVNGASVKTHNTDIYNNTRNAILASTGTYLSIHGGSFRTTNSSSPAIQMGDGRIEDATVSSGSHGLWAFGEIALDRVLFDGCRNQGVLAQNNAQVSILNSIFANNQGLEASGVTVRNRASVDIVNTTFHATEPELPTFRALHSGTLTVFNSIVAGPIDAPVASIEGDNASVSVQYSLTNLPFDGEGNLVGSPEFVEADVGDYTLAPNSPAIDAADPRRAPQTDILGNSRVDLGDLDDAYVDMGALERQF